MGECFDDSGLADPRLANQNGVVLGAAAQDLGDSLYRSLAPNGRIEFASPSESGEVGPKLIQCGGLGCRPSSAATGRLLHVLTEDAASFGANLV